MVLSTTQTAQVPYPRILIGAMINVTSTPLPISAFYCHSFSYPTLRIMLRRCIDDSWSMGAHIVASGTLSFYRPPAEARLTAIATPTTHLGRAVWLGHLERQRAFLDG